VSQPLLRLRVRVVVEASVAVDGSDVSDVSVAALPSSARAFLGLLYLH
jgi:hypothetical protein